MPGEPTSVKIVGDLALAGVDMSTSFTAPSGRLVVATVVPFLQGDVAAGEPAIAALRKETLS